MNTNRAGDSSARPAIARGWRGAVAVLAMICAGMTSAMAAETAPLLFAPAPAVGATNPAAKPPLAKRATANEKAVAVNFDYLDPRSGTNPATLAVPLFDGETIVIERTRVEERGPGNYTWTGRVLGYARSDALLTVVNGQIAGTIVVVDEVRGRTDTYQLQSTRTGAQVLRRINPAALPPDHPPGADRLMAPKPDAGGGKPRSSFPGKASVGAADASGAIDIMIVYSNQSAAASGAAIAAEVQQAVDMTNLAYVNSGVAAKLRLVYYGLSGYDEVGFFDDLDRLTDPGDGYLDDVLLLRDVYRADVVSLFVESEEFCGLGWIQSTADNAFSVVNRFCGSTTYTLAHELGHNFGARHDTYVDPTGEPYSYGHGYVYLPGQWRTVMAYDDQCLDHGFSCTRLPNFSNPDVDYFSVPTGNPEVNNVARVLNERAFALANFRLAAAPAAPASCRALPTPASLPSLGGPIAITGGCADGGVPTAWSWKRDGSAVGVVPVTLADTVPSNAGEVTVSHVYSGIACNDFGCAPAVTTTVTVLATPTVITSAASAITATAATLNATIFSGSGASVAFQYGVTLSYGNTVVPAQSPLRASSTASAVAAALTGLACNRTYHYRAVGVSGVGTTQGNDMTFTTGACGTNAKLAGLAVSEGVLAPAFANDTAAYVATVTGANNSVRITPTAMDATATVRVMGVVVPSGASSAAIALTSGTNLITVQVTAQDGTTTTLYTVNAFYRSPSASVQVVEYYNASLDHYFITWFPEEIAALESGTGAQGWQRVGVWFSAYTQAQTGTTPVCRYYIPPGLGNSHFFGRSPEECAATAQSHPSFILEYPAVMHMFLPTAGVCPVNTTPVYRVFNNRADANHRYTSSNGVRDEMIAQGWIAEGDGPNRVAMCAPR